MTSLPLSLQLWRFAGVGGLATLVHTGLAYAVHGLGLADPAAANLAGFAGGVATGYLGHFYWTFAGAGDHRRSLYRFAMTAALNLGWTSLVVAVAERLGWPFAAALAVILVTVPPLNFLVSRLWVFTR